MLSFEKKIFLIRYGCFAGERVCGAAHTIILEMLYKIL